MDLYKGYDVHILAKDEDKAREIIELHDRKGDVDDYTIEFIYDSKRGWTVTFRIKPIIYEDLETIIDEFRKAGIQVW